MAGDKVLIEDCLVGVEASLIAISDGERAISLASSQDHKRIFEKDEGPNTGGMGAYSPTPYVSEKLKKDAEDIIFNPLIKELKKQGHAYIGFIYAGVMLTKKGFEVLEFNVRFGDPEAQAILRECVEVRRPDLTAVATDVAEAEVVGHDEDDVRRRIGYCIDGDRGNARAEAQCAHDGQGRDPRLCGYLISFADRQFLSTDGHRE